MNVKERLKTYITSQSQSITDFEKSLNVANGYVNSIAKNIGIDKITLVVEKYPNLNIEWLLTGKGEMLKQPQPPVQVSQTESEVVKHLINKLTDQAGEIAKLNAEILRLQKEVNEFAEFRKARAAAASELKHEKKK